MRPDTLGVIGLGAIGGSVAWGATHAGVPRVLGYTQARREGVEALKRGVVTELAHSVRQVVQHADLVVFAAPPAATVELLRRHAPLLAGRDVVATDVTSVKAPVAQVAADGGLGHVFAGSHPFAGTHERGFGAARSNLLRGALVYVTPCAGDDRPVREVAHFWEDVFGAAPVVMDAVQHDTLLAWTSHLPQVTASALAAALAGAGPRGVTYGRGARDTTRLAASSTEMWRDILLMNRAQVAEALTALDDTVGELRRALADGDAEAVTRWLGRGHRWRTGLDT